MDNTNNGNGGAIEILNNNKSTVSIKSSRFSNNMSKMKGSAVFIEVPENFSQSDNTYENNSAVLTKMDIATDKYKVITQYKGQDITATTSGIVFNDFNSGNTISDIQIIIQDMFSNPAS